MVTNLDKVKVMVYLTVGLGPIKGKKLQSSLYDIPPKSLNDIYLHGESICRKMKSIGSYKDNRRDNRYSSRSDNKSKRNYKYDTRRDNRDVAKIDKAAEHRKDRENTTLTVGTIGPWHCVL